MTSKNNDVSIEEKIQDFTELLTQIDGVSDKKKKLWKEIYENAIVDRTNAHILFTDLYSNMGGSAADHATLGQTLTKYLERMSKSNEQLLSLSKQIADSETSSVEMSEDEIFERIKK